VKYTVTSNGKSMSPARGILRGRKVWSKSATRMVTQRVAGWTRKASTSRWGVTGIVLLDYQKDAERVNHSFFFAGQLVVV